MNYRTTSVEIESSLYRRIKDYCVEKRVSLKKVINLSLKKFLDEENKE